MDSTYTYTYAYAYTYTYTYTFAGMLSLSCLTSSLAAGCSMSPHMHMHIHLCIYIYVCRYAEPLMSDEQPGSWMFYESTYTYACTYTYTYAGMPSRSCPTSSLAAGCSMSPTSTLTGWPPTASGRWAMATCTCTYMCTHAH